MVYYYCKIYNVERSWNSIYLQRNLNFNWNDVTFHRIKHQKLQNTIRIYQSRKMELEIKKSVFGWNQIGPDGTKNRNKYEQSTPLKEFESLELWKVIEEAIEELVKNNFAPRKRS